MSTKRCLFLTISSRSAAILHVNLLQKPSLVTYMTIILSAVSAVALGK